MPSASALRQLAFRTTALVAASASIAFAAGCGSSSDSSSSGGSSSSTTSSEATTSSSSSSSSTASQIQASTGKEIFQKAGCVSCHTLAAAGGAGNIGPNLDESKPGEVETVNKVTNGDGNMPSFKGRLSAAQIETVAKYVSSVAGK